LKEFEREIKGCWGPWADSDPCGRFFLALAHVLSRPQTVSLSNHLDSVMTGMMVKVKDIF